MKTQETNKQETSSPLEHEIKNFNQEYHGTQIRIMEFDHDTSIQGNKEYKMPDNWRTLLKEQLDKTEGPIAPEYCMPDLENKTFFEPGTGEIARRMSEDLKITPFFGHISKLAGAQGRTLIATDSANTAWYGLFEKASAAHTLFEKMLRDSAPNITTLLKLKKYAYDYNNIEPGEHQMHTANDGRHLITARGLMQYALVSEQQNITSIWAPKHAERIDDYIKRQKRTEEVSQKKVQKPSDFRSISPKEEKKKMKIYGRPPLPRKIREYIPILPPEAYKIDLIVNDPSLRDNHDKIMKVINDYLEMNPSNEMEKEIQDRIKRVKRELEKRIKDDDTSKYEEVSKKILTDRFGWKLKKKNYIY